MASHIYRLLISPAGHCPILFSTDRIPPALSFLQQYHHHWASSTKHLLHSGQCTFRCGIHHHSVSFEWCWAKQEQSISLYWWAYLSNNVNLFLATNLSLLFACSCAIIPLWRFPGNSWKLAPFLLVQCYHKSSLTQFCFLQLLLAILESINLTQIVAASTLGVVAISCGFLLSTMCIWYCVIRRRKTPKRKDKDSKHLAAISQSQNSDTWSGTTFGLLHTFADIIPQ